MLMILIRSGSILALAINLFFLDIRKSYSTDITLSLNFAGVWESKEVELKQVELDEEECVFCTQEVKQCSPGQVLVHQTCKECAHCVEEKEANLEKDKDTTSTRDKKEKVKARKNIKMELCIKENRLVGIIDIEEKITSGLIKSCSVISESKVFLNILDKENQTHNLIIELLEKKEMLVNILGYGAFKAKKVKVKPQCFSQ